MSRTLMETDTRAISIQLGVLLRGFEALTSAHSAWLSQTWTGDDRRGSDDRRGRARPV
jgi:hypothetical protein